MFLITDRNGVIVDMASRLENLSRGYAFADHIVVELDQVDMILGDTSKDGLLTRNMENRLRIMERASDEAKIRSRMRQLAVADLQNKGELPAEYE